MVRIADLTRATLTVLILGPDSVTIWMGGRRLQPRVTYNVGPSLPSKIPTALSATPSATFFVLWAFHPQPSRRPSVAAMTYPEQQPQSDFHLF